jgi:hypothetical protein
MQLQSLVFIMSAENPANTNQLNNMVAKLSQPYFPVMVFLFPF